MMGTNRNPVMVLKRKKSFKQSYLAGTRKILNSFHESQSNKHTVIVRENVVFLFWAIIEGKTVPEVVRDRN